MRGFALIGICLLAASWPGDLSAQAWRNCVPNSIGPSGCDSIGPGGGQSIGPGGGQSIGPRGGQSLTRDKTKGLDTNTMRPYPCRRGGRCY